VEKCVGHSLKNLGPSQETLRPTCCTELVTGLVERTQWCRNAHTQHFTG